MLFLIFIAVFGALGRISYGALSPYRDSGDIIASAVCLGIAHPPGYPLYVLLSKIWLILFPFANFAFRANLFSVFCSALAAAFLFRALSRWISKPAALVAVSLWVLAPSCVQLSIVSEMYALNSLLCALLLWLASKASDRSPDIERWLALAFFVLGLGLNNHPTLVFMLPGVMAYSWLILPKKSAGEKLKAFVRFFLWSGVGFSLVIFVPIRSFQNPELDWGNAESIKNLWRLVTRSDYGGLKMHPEQSQFIWSGQGILSQIKLFLNAAKNQMGWIGLILFALGILSSVRKKFRKPQLLLFFIPWLLTGPLFFVLSNLPIAEKTTLPILEPYLMMAQLLASYWIAAGWESAAFFKPRIKWGLSAALSLAIITVLLPHSRRNDFYAYDYGKNLYKTLPPESSLYEPDDVTAFTLSYFQVAEGYRKDVALLMTLKTFWGYEQIKRRYPGIVPQAEFPDARSFIAALLNRHMETSRPLLADHPSKFPSLLPQSPLGLLARAGPAPSLSEFKKMQGVFHLYAERGAEQKASLDFFSAHLLSKMSAGFNNAGIWLQNQKDFEGARQYFEKALQREPRLTQAWNNLGLNYFLQSDFAGAERIFRRGLARGEAPSSLYVPLGLAQRRLGMLGLAKQSLKEGLKAHPADVTGWNELGLIYMQERKWKEAKSHFEKAVDIQKNFATGHYNLGLVNRAIGLRKEAAKNFEDYIKNDPGAADAGIVRQWIRALAP